MAKLSNSDKQTAYQLSKKGYKQKDIAALLHVTQPAVSQVCKEMDLKDKVKKAK